MKRTINSVQVVTNNFKRTYRSDDEKMRIIDILMESRRNKTFINDCHVLGIQDVQFYTWCKKFNISFEKQKQKRPKTLKGTDFEVFEREMKSEIDNVLLEMYNDWVSEKNSKIDNHILNELTRETGLTKNEILILIKNNIELETV